MSERYSHDHQPLQPFELPPDLAAFLQTQDLACQMQATSEGTAFVLKLPGHEIVSVRGRVPVGLRHELLSHPCAPVIRTLLTIHDQPGAPLALETFTNVADEQQAQYFKALALQERFLLLFYDEALRHQLTKVVPQQRDPQVLRIAEYARRIRAMIPAEKYDFDEAKRAVITTRRL